MLQMEQKDYKMEIINLLLHGNDHARSMAKKININHMTINRKLNELLNENVVDFNLIGRNQSYFLKHTAESLTFIKMAEYYKLLSFLRKYPQMRNIIEIIKNDKRISLAAIFGSYAKGVPSIESDIDLFIETQDSSIKKEYLLFDSKLSIKIGVL